MVDVEIFNHINNGPFVKIYYMIKISVITQTDSSLFTVTQHSPGEPVQRSLHLKKLLLFCETKPPAESTGHHWTIRLDRYGAKMVPSITVTQAPVV